MKSKKSNAKIKLSPEKKQQLRSPNQNKSKNNTSVLTQSPPPIQVIVKIPPPQPLPLTEQQIQLEKEKEQALERINQIQQVSMQTQGRNTTFLLKSALQNVQKDIVASIVEVAEEPHEISKLLHQRKLKEKEKTSLNESQVLDNQYKSLLLKKQTMISQLRQMEYQQVSIRKQLTESALLSPPQQKFNKMPQLSESAKQHWRKIRLMVKEHQKNSHKMHEINLKKNQQQKMLQFQLEEKRKKQQSLQKKKHIEMKIQEIKKRHNQRSQHIKESQSIIQKLQGKTKLFQKMEENWNKLQQKIKTQNEAALIDNYQNKRSVSVRKLKNYEEEHDIRFQQKEEGRKRKLNQSTINYSTHRDKTRFSVDILVEAKKLKQVQEEKLHQIKELFNKRMSYATTLKQRFRSSQKTDKKRENSSEKKTLTKEMRSMTALDIKNKGNEYMRTMNQGLSSLKGQSQSKKEIKNPPQIEKKQYKNYLPEVLKKNGILEQGNSKQKGLNLINTILQKGKSSNEQKLFQVQMITKKMQSTGTQKQLLDSINAKIQVLKKLSYNN